MTSSNDLSIKTSMKITFNPEPLFPNLFLHMYLYVLHRHKNGPMINVALLFFSLVLALCGNIFLFIFHMRYIVIH